MHISRRSIIRACLGGGASFLFAEALRHVLPWDGAEVRALTVGIGLFLALLIFPPPGGRGAGPK